jgi:hypothetical protein
LNVRTLYEIMVAAWEVSPYWLLDECMSSVDFLQVRRVERAAETRRNFCFWLPSGLSRHARWRGNVCLPRHPLRRGSPGNMGAKDGDLYPGLPRHKAWRGSSTLSRHAAWRGKTALPRLSFTKTRTLPRPKF